VIVVSLQLLFLIVAELVQDACFDRADVDKGECIAGESPKSAVVVLILGYIVEE
jgi:hypothetical protein